MEVEGRAVAAVHHNGAQIWPVAPTYEEAIASANGGPTYRYKFDGDLTPSAAGPNLSGPASYTPTIIPKDAGQCLAASGEINLANQGDINSGDQTRSSMALWFRALNTNGNKGIYEQGGGTNWKHLYLVDDVLYWNVGSSNNNRGFITVPIQAGETYFVVAEIDNPNNILSLYLNGALVQSTTHTIGASFPSHSGDITIGGASDPRDHNGSAGGKGNFAGEIADWCFWANAARLLTAQEVSDIYAAGAA